MRTLSKVALAVASFGAAVATAAPASAAPMDPATDRLYTEPAGLPAGINCQQIAANPNLVLTTKGFPKGALPNSYPCMPNNAAWANMMSELGYAIAPSAFHPARTTGLGGFALSLEASFAHINSGNSVTNADGTTTNYWQQGTQGQTQPNGSYGTSNTSPDSVLQVYSLKARKGLPFGFEIAGALGFVANTTLWVGGADVHWAVLEGYRTGFLGYLPDIAVGGGVRTMSGQQSFYLTTVGIDAQVSKPIALSDSSVITPYVGGQRLMIYANSSIVDLTPSVDAFAQCGYQGTNVQGNPNAPGNTNGNYDGSPVCKNKLANGAPNNSDFNNQVTFQKQTFYRWRGIVGLTYRYELLYLAAQFATDMEDPGAENSIVTGSKQWTLSFETGVFF